MLFCDMVFWEEVLRLQVESFCCSYCNTGPPGYLEDIFRKEVVKLNSGPTAMKVKSFAGANNPRKRMRKTNTLPSTLLK